MYEVNLGDAHIYTITIRFLYMIPAVKSSYMNTVYALCKLTITDRVLTKY